MGEREGVVLESDSRNLAKDLDWSNGRIGLEILAFWNVMRPELEPFFPPRIWAFLPLFS